MTFAQLVARALYARGVHDIFGIPGAVLLDMLYEAANEGVRPRISYNEQSAAFAATGYAQAAGYGCAFATKGPGVTNLLTGIADAWCESARVLFLTAHSGRSRDAARRLTTNQEVDAVAMAAPVTLVSERVDSPDEAVRALERALAALDAPRGGTALLDVHASLWSADVGASPIEIAPPSPICTNASELDARIRDFMCAAERPVVLVGQGARTHDPAIVRAYLSSLGAPIVTSRPALDVACGLPHALGYVGSRGIRAANHALAHATDLLVLGNRMGFPDGSASFGPLVGGMRILRFDADPSEFERPFACESHVCDLRAFLSAAPAPTAPTTSAAHARWLAECDRAAAALFGADATEPVVGLMRLLEGIDPSTHIAVDIGNNSHWFSIAAHELGLPNRQLHSHSFGALGSALGRAIGAALAGAPHVVCIVGDQGLQMNSQELQLVRDLDLSITVVLLNNKTSGMIRDRELRRENFLLTTADSGYGTPDFAALAAAYGLPHALARDLAHGTRPALAQDAAPLVVELPVDATIEARPNLPLGASLDCQVPPPLTHSGTHKPVFDPRR